MHLNFEVMASLNYRFIGNLHARVFSTLNQDYDYFECFFYVPITGTGRCCKTIAYHIYLCLSHTLVHVTFSKNLVFYNPAYIYDEF